MNARQKPDAGSVAGRLKMERQRLEMSQPAFAAVAGVSKNGVVNWEAGKSSPPAVPLAALAKAGADILFIVTGQPTPIMPASEQALAGVTVRQALAMLDPSDRHRLLLDLLAGELRG